MKKDALDFDELGINLDKIDMKILKLLADDSRISYAEIARKVHLSRMAVRERVIKMVDEGVIERFTVQLNSKKVGLTTAVLLTIKANPSLLNNIANELSNHPKIESIYAVTGKNELHVHAFVEDFSTLEQFIFEEIYKIEGITEVDFSIMTRRYKNSKIFM